MFPKIHNLKLLLTLSIFSLFTIFTINTTFAQDFSKYDKQVTYENIKCGDFTICKVNSQLKLFLDTKFRFNYVFLNYICKEKTQNINSKHVNYSMENEGGDKITFRISNDGSNVSGIGLTKGKTQYIKNITCNIPETEEEKQAKLQEEQERQKQEQKQREREKQNQTSKPLNQIEGCTDPTAINYDNKANIHDEKSCIYPPQYIPQNITGYIENSSVNYNATTWNIKINTNIDGAMLDINKIQTWNKFTPVNITTQDKQIIITFKQFNDKRLDVECTNYELTIPKNAITTDKGDKNQNSITGNFEVVNCPENQNQQNTNIQNQDEENKTTNINNAKLDENKTYLPIISQKNGVFYIDIKAVAFLLLFVLITFSFSYVFYKLFTKKY